MGDGTRKVTLQGTSFNLSGEEVCIDRNAPEFNVISNELKVTSSLEFSGRSRLICSVPSLDTPVCNMEIHRLSEYARHFFKDTAVLFISMDLPFAQKRFCEENHIEGILTLSDHKNADFGLKYGVLIEDLRLLARAVFIIGKDDKVKYVEYVPEVASLPNYEKILEEIKKLN